MADRLRVLVEGPSDAAAVAALVVLTGADPDAVDVVPMGGAMSIGHHLPAVADPREPRTVALCDEREAPYLHAAAERAGVALTVLVCRRDLEDELIAALGEDAVEAVVDGQGELRSLRSLQQQPAHRDTPPRDRLRRFFGSGATRKIRYAPLLVAALDPGRLTPALARLAALLPRR